jgi:outer membrane receptor protein involved in Fe transport
MRGSHLLALMASASTLVMAAPAFAASQGNTVQEVIVTADKTAQSQKNVPMSITALPGDKLEQLDAHSFTDYAKLVPGLDVEATAPGESRLTLRGLNAGGVASTVAAYVDETPMGSSSGLVDGAVFTTDFDTFDMQRVEVLRGPQGTLYGANTEGGLIKFVTNAPNLSNFGAMVDGSVSSVAHGQVGGSIDGMVNVPLGGTAGVRMTGYHTVMAGYIDDPLLGQHDVNRGTKDGLRASFLWKPSDKFSLRLTGFGQNMKLEGTSSEDIMPGADLTHLRYHNEPRSFQYRNLNATATYDMGWATLVSSTSYGSVNIASTGDVSAILFPGVVEFQTTDDSKFTQELRIVSPKSDHLEWLAGLYWTNEQGGIHQNIALFSIPSQATVLNGLELASINSKYSEQAVFGTLTYHFTPQFDVQVGGRYGNIVQHGSEFLGGLLINPSLSHATDSGEHVTTYSVAPRWHVTDTTMLYARVASGFRPGGPNVTPVAAPPGTPLTYNSDSTVSYEAGVKTSLLDGSLSIDAAIFRTDWKDIQLFEVVNSTGVNGNGGTARSQGFEWDATWVPLHGLTLLFTGAYTDAKLTSPVPAAAFPFVHAFNGDPLPWVPKWSAALDGEYKWAAFGDVNAFVGATWAYTGDRPTDFSSSAQTRLSSYNTVDLRGGAEWGRYRAQLFAKNVGDQRAFTAFGGPTLAGGTGASVIMPRTIGLDLSAKF